MKIGWLGLGKLGMPCALAMAEAGHDVVGVDPDPTIAKAVETAHWPHDEPGVELLLRTTATFRLGPLEEAARSDLVFVAVQTPHAPGYGGEVPMPTKRQPFDATWLEAAVRDLTAALDDVGSLAPVAIVSTVLPGTCADVVEPLLGARPYAYTPAFVAMGSVLDDLAQPEFVLLGLRDERAEPILRNAFGHVPAPVLTVGVESAELAKMAYNTAISQKIVLANALMELASNAGADVDEVSMVLEHATDRVASERYLRAGLGDGGPCHPRDGIALSWLAERAGLSADPFGFAVTAREAQARWLAARVGAMARVLKLPIVIAGRAYKAGVSITDGSAALLVAHYLNEMGHEVTWYDPRCGYPDPPKQASVVLLAVPDRVVEWPDGSVVVDPWGRASGPDVVRLGRTL